MKNIPNEKYFLKQLSDMNIEVISINHKFLQNNVVFRFEESLQYLKKHKNEFDRVILFDVRDAGLFGDYFATFNSSTIGWLTESYGLHKASYLSPKTFYPHYRWMKLYYNKTIADDLKQRAAISINGGFGYGGIDLMIDLLEKLCKEFVGKKNSWGLDQAALNYLYHCTDQLSHLQLERCSPKICYKGRYTNEVKDNTIINMKSGCSPVAYHKIVYRNKNILK